MCEVVGYMFGSMVCEALCSNAVDGKRADSQE